MKLYKNLYGVSGGIKTGKDLVGQMIQFLGDAITNGEKTPTFEEFMDYITPRKYKVDRVQTYEIKKCADKLKDCICLLIGCTREELEDQDFKNKELGEEWWYYKNCDHMGNESISPYVKEEANEYTKGCHKHTPRTLLQLFGTQGGRMVVHPNIWVNALFADYTKIYIGLPSDYGLDVKDENYRYTKKWIITDVRFPQNEGKAIHDRNGHIFGIKRKFGLRFPEYKHLMYDDSPYVIPEELKDENPVLYKNLTHVSETSMGDFSWCDYVITNDGTIEELFDKILMLVAVKEEMV